MKKSQRIFAGVLAVLISIAMVGSAVAGYFVGNVPSADSSSVNAAADYQARKLRIEAMVQRTKVDPENVPLQKALGDEYYDAGREALSIAPSEMQDNFKKAVEAYQNVLKTNKDPNIMVDMATSAFYSGDNDLAEKGFQEALVLNPEFFNALSNYGIFLSQAKQDWAGALTQWQKALNLAQNSSEKEWINARISQAQSALEANPPTNGISNPNPALNNGEEKPATP